MSFFNSFGAVLVLAVLALLGVVILYHEETRAYCSLKKSYEEF
jgi:hypothetical protein